jgi:hypothetical protein
VARLERCIALVFDISLFILVRLVLVETTFAEFRSRSHGASNPPLPPGKIRPTQAHFIFEQERLADQLTDDKVKQLLALTSSLSALVTAIALSHFGLAADRIVLILVPLLAAVYICLGGLMDVRRYSLPTISEASADPEEQEWVRGVIAATGFNRGSRFFRVDLYRAALRWFLLALLIAPFAVAFHATAGTSVASKVRAIPHPASPNTPSEGAGDLYRL